MTLVEALHTMRRAGFTQVLDRHSHFPKEIEDVLGEADLDLNDYTPRPDHADIIQNHPHPCNHYVCS